ncbi:hypothetical protein BDR04DRAFT_1117054 [Suillus decipiens]|nr:hypothetical protein BDR04DRAFT_1117054 [Suillus decipiens]
MYLLTASQNVTKEVKKVRLAITEPRIHQPIGKDKGKEKAVAVKEPELYDLPCAKCSDEHKCVITYGIRGLLVKACGRCFTLKVKCEQPVANTALTDRVRVSHPWSKATLVSKSKPALRMTRATSCTCPPMLVVESKDAMNDAYVAVAAHEDVKMSHEADAKRPTHIAAMTPTEPEVDHPVAIASADDFPADHWQKDPDAVVMPPPSPPYFLSPLPHLTEPTILDVESIVHNRVVALAACVAAMEADLDTTVILVDGLLNMVETLWWDCSAQNPLFLLPIADPNVASSATTLGRRYLNSVFNPSVAPSTNSVGITEALTSHPFGHPDAQGTTFTSGQVTAEPVHAGPSSVSVLDGPLSVPMQAGSLSTASSPPSKAHTLP